MSAGVRVRVAPVEDRGRRRVVVLADDPAVLTVLVQDDGAPPRRFAVARSTELEAEAVADALVGGTGSFRRVAATVERLRDAWPLLLTVGTERHFLGRALADPRAGAGRACGYVALCALALEPDPDLRLAVARNASTPLLALARLRSDDDPRVAAAAAATSPEPWAHARCRASRLYRAPGADGPTPTTPLE